MAQRLIKVNLRGYQCRGIYFEDSQNLFESSEIDDSYPHQKIKPPFKIILRTTVMKRGKKVTSKKTFSFTDKGITFKRAVEKVSGLRDSFRDDLTFKRKEEVKKNVTLREAWDQYISERDANGKLSKQNIDIQKLVFDKYMEEIEHLPVSQIETEDLQQIVNSILASGKKPRTAKLIQDYLRPFFKAAKIYPNPATDIELPTFDNTVRFELSKPKAKALVQAMSSYPEPTIRGVMSFLLDGRRLGEILLMEWTSVNIPSRSYTVQSFTTKNRKTAQYQLRDDTAEVLDAIPKISKYIFPARIDTNRPMSKETFRNHWVKILQKLDINMRIHDIRHLIGGTLVNSGATLEQIAAVLGHSSTTITKRYSKVKKETAANALNQFHNAMK
ncbi:MAG: tyrosine-type recombinase/integrase [Campylobacterota bacterium]